MRRARRQVTSRLPFWPVSDFVAGEVAALNGTRSGGWRLLRC